MIASVRINFLTMNTIFYVTNDYSIVPIQLDLVKSFLRVTLQDDDHLITTLIKSAINYAENKLGIVIGKKDYECKFYADSQDFVILKPHLSSINFVKIDGVDVQYDQKKNTVQILTPCIGSMVQINFTCDNSYCDASVQLTVMRHVFYLYENRSVTDINSREIESIYNTLIPNNYNI